MLMFVKARSIQTKLIEKPSLLQETCEDIDNFKNGIQSSSMTEHRPYNLSSSRRFYKRQICFCPSSTNPSELRRFYKSLFHHQSQSHGPYWGARFTSSIVIHHKSCPLAKDVEEEKSWGLRIVYCGRIIARAVTMSINLRWGAGGYSIGPTLSCDRLVPCDNLVFKMLENYKSIVLMEPAVMTKRIDHMIRIIGNLYQNGKASIYDVDEEGNNAIQVSYLADYSVFLSTNINAAKKLGTWPFWMNSSNEPYKILFRLLKYLCDCGVRIDRVNAQGMYVMVLSSRSIIEIN